MERESTHGGMEESIRGSTIMIRNMDMESTPGQMGGSTKVF